MKAEKKEKLEAAGWSIGDASDFLQLSPEEKVFVEMKVALAEAVKQQRIRRNWTQSYLAKRITSSQSRVAKIEACDSSVSFELFFRSLLALGNTPEDLARILKEALSGTMPEEATA